jgi:hypothetical protein
MILGEWVNIVRGFDPAAEIRGTYGDPDVCPIGRAYRADPVPLGDRLLAALPVVDHAALGDIAFVAIPGQRFLSGAIKLKRNAWAMKTASKGVQVARHVQPVRIWGVGYAA